MEIGIVGLPNVGKSTIFNALTSGEVAAANYPFCTIEPNVGVTELADPRLARLAEIFQPEKVVPAIVRFVDIAGIVKDAHKGEGLGNKFLANIREVDAICQVVRCFEDPDVTHVHGDIEPIRDIEVIQFELIFADIETVERRIQRVEKLAKQDLSVRPELEYLRTLKGWLEEGKLASAYPTPEEFHVALKEMCLLSQKPMIYVANVSEADLPDGGALAAKIRARGETVVLSGAIEAEIARLGAEERAAFLSDLGLAESGLDRLARAAFRLLELETFLTGGPKEVRAWTYHKGSKAPQAAGVIHTDFERGFIKADIISFEDLDRIGNMVKAREAGRIRSEGKEYVMQDGDVVIFKFAV
jgi:hypothetical protein